MNSRTTTRRCRATKRPHVARGAYRTAWAINTGVLRPSAPVRESAGPTTTGRRLAAFRHSPKHVFRQPCAEKVGDLACQRRRSPDVPAPVKVEDCRSNRELLEPALADPTLAQFVVRRFPLRGERQSFESVAIQFPQTKGSRRFAIRPQDEF